MGSYVIQMMQSSIVQRLGMQSMMVKVKDQMNQHIQIHLHQLLARVKVKSTFLTLLATLSCGKLVL